uniref:Nematode cuticle collagen N-terminal domain-containing protein n=1 Tax=Panagrellus redivivus TaxID=6233 RepID=A0A7E4UZ54_PANRE
MPQLQDCSEHNLFRNSTAIIANVSLILMGIMLFMFFTTTSIFILNAVSNASLSKEEVEQIVNQDRTLGNLISEHFILKHHRLDEDPMLSDKARTDEASEDAE